MNWEHKIDMDMVRYIVLGIAVILILAILMFNPGWKITRYDRESIEVQVVEKEIRETDGQTLYLLYCQEEDGKESIFEINQDAIGERFNPADVYKQLRKEKYYKFRVAQKEEFDSQYPCICGAVKLIDGFSEPAKAEKK
ncbi:MAG: hypothetical protein HFG54_02960 [Lachnospiraceae bacterium]|nr:hypothetical protein [Lachnospiraceae bacterium]